MVIRLNDLTPDDSTFPNGYHIRLVKFEFKKRKKNDWTPAASFLYL